MGLVDKIDQDLNQALKVGDQAGLSTLRLLKNGLSAAAKDKQTALSDDEAIKIVAKEVKQRRESISSYKRGGRNDLVAKEQAEIELLEQYLPAQLSDEELARVVEQAIKVVGASAPGDIGKVIGTVMSKVGGGADGTKVSALVRKHLSS